MSRKPCACRPEILAKIAFFVKHGPAGTYCRVLRSKASGIPRGKKVSLGMGWEGSRNETKRPSSPRTCPRLVRHGFHEGGSFREGGGGDPVILSLGKVVMERRKDLRAMRFTNDTTENRPFETSHLNQRCARKSFIISSNTVHVLC